jgi:hypothetical protein
MEYEFEHSIIQHLVARPEGAPDPKAPLVTTSPQEPQEAQEAGE